MDCVRPMSTLSLLLAGLVMVMEVRGQAFDCSSYNPNICTMDAIMFCLTNGTIVTGRCYAMRAVCVENKKLDETFSACSDSVSRGFDCSQYKPIVCTKDLIPYCLRNGTIIRGTCAAKRAVCVENQQLEQDFSVCNKEKPILYEKQPRQDGQGRNGAAAMVSPSLILLLLLSSWA